MIRDAEYVIAARKLRSEGATFPVIAARLGGSPLTARKACLFGAGQEQKNKISPAKQANVCKMFAAGLSKRQIARRLGIAECSVKWILDHAPAEPAASENTAIIPPRMVVRLTERVQRMRDSLKARGMAPEMALREAMRICAGSAVEDRGISRAAGGVCGSFHAPKMEQPDR